MWRPIALWKAGSMVGVAALMVTVSLMGSSEAGADRVPAVAPEVVPAPAEMPIVTPPEVTAPAWEASSAGWLAAAPLEIEWEAPGLEAPSVLSAETDASGVFAGIGLRPIQVSVAAPVVAPAPWEVEARLRPVSLEHRSSVRYAGPGCHIRMA